jgi:hypothetical protein
MTYGHAMEPTDKSTPYDGLPKSFTPVASNIFPEQDLSLSPPSFYYPPTPQSYPIVSIEAPTSPWPTQPTSQWTPEPTPQWDTQPPFSPYYQQISQSNTVSSIETQTAYQWGKQSTYQSQTFSAPQRHKYSIHQWGKQSTYPLQTQTAQPMPNTYSGSQPPLISQPVPLSQDTEQDPFSKVMSLPYNGNQTPFIPPVIDLSQDREKKPRAKKPKSKGLFSQTVNPIPNPDNVMSTSSVSPLPSLVKDSDVAQTVYIRMLKKFKKWQICIIIKSFLNCDIIEFHNVNGTLSPNVCNLSNSQSKIFMSALIDFFCLNRVKAKRTFHITPRFNVLAEHVKQNFFDIAASDSVITTHTIWQIQNNSMLEFISDQLVKTQLTSIFNEQYPSNTNFPTLIDSFATPKTLSLNLEHGTMIPNKSNVSREEVKFMAKLLIEYNYLIPSTTDNDYTPSPKLKKFHASLSTPDVTTVSYETVPSKTTI